MEYKIKWNKRSEGEPEASEVYLVCGYGIDKKYKRYAKQMLAYYHRTSGWSGATDMTIEYWTELPSMPFN